RRARAARGRVADGRGRERNEPDSDGEAGRLARGQSVGAGEGDGGIVRGGRVGRGPARGGRLDLERDTARQRGGERPAGSRGGDVRARLGAGSGRLLVTWKV